MSPLRPELFFVKRVSLAVPEMAENAGKIVIFESARRPVQSLPGGQAPSVVAQMDDILSRAWDQLLARPTGPFQFRFILQPLMAVFLGIRAGMNGSQDKLLPIFSTDTDREIRACRTHPRRFEGHREIVHPCGGPGLHLVEIRWIYPLQAGIVGVVLAIIPYIGVRGPANRLANRMIARRD